MARTAGMDELVFLVPSDQFGRGEAELGAILMRAAIKKIAELDPRPGAVVFVNTGVRLSCEGSAVLDDLRALEASGTRVLSCGTCLDYFRLKDSLQAGSVSNMGEIISTLSAASRLVTL